MSRKEKQKDAGNRGEVTDFKVSIAEEESAADATDNLLDAGKEKRQDKPETKGTQAEEQSDMIKMLHNITSEEDEKQDTHTPLTLASVLGGDILGGRWFRKQFWYMLMLTGMIVVYVANRYACQQEMIQTKILSDTLLDRRYKALTRSSQLKERTRRSYIEQNLPDSALQTAKTPSFNLPVEE